MAVALGVGGFILALPAVADADTGTGNSGKTTSSAPSKAGPKASGAVSSKRAQAGRSTDELATAPKSLGTSRRVRVDLPGGSGDSLTLAALALRRESSTSNGALAPAATVTTGEPATSAAALPAAAGDAATWNGQIAPALTNFIKTGIGYAGLDTQRKALVDAVLPTIVDVLGAAYTQGPVNSALTSLSNNQTLLNLVTSQIETGLTANGLPTEAAHVVGQAAGYLTQNILGNTAIQNAVGTVVHALSVVPNGSTTAAFIATLNSPGYTLQDYVGQVTLQSAPAVIKSVPVVLADSAFRSAVFSTIKGAAHVLVGLSGWKEAPSSAWVTFIGDQVELALGDGLDTNPVTAVVVLAGRAAVEHLLGSAVIVDGALGTVETGVSTFLDYAGVGTALANAANSVADAIANGTEQQAQAAWEAATQALQANPALHLALGQSLKGAVQSVIGNTGVLNEISATVETFLASVTSDPTIHAALLEQLGAQYGNEIVDVLNDPAAMDKLIGSITTALPKFLQAKGVSDALGGAVNQAVLAVFSSADPNAALQGIVAELQANPAIQAALKSALATAVRGVLSVHALEDAASRIAGYAVQDFFDSAGINNPTVERLATNALKSVVSSLLGDGSVRKLVGSLVGDLASGTPGEDVVRSLVNSVLGSPGLQLAIGQAVGSAVGSLFGGGPIGYLVGQFVGIPTGLFIVVNALPLMLVVRSGLLDGLFAQIGGFVMAQAPTGA
ncbi:hypothetical protein [Mycolicibacterium sphagni]|uniref:PE-PGRS family protein n=1 Tax=Mycolicibacterium sphagni TaxID=1786 RepID=A0ABX2K817_9MYCO|nr:hypothetical protein [Mycolicibacterium sphagni]NTY62325.1 hypothetical protein [Mycolicibacterium sphagni]